MPTFRKFFTRQMKWEKIVAAIAAIPGFDKLLLEDGNKLLLEDGDKMLLENGYLIEDDVEYANAGAALAAGWTNANTPTWGYTTVILQGNYSFYYASNSGAFKSFSPVSGVNFSSVLQFDATPSTNRDVLYFRNGTTTLMLLEITSAFRFRATPTGGTGTTGSFVCSLNTPVYIWIDYVRSTGSNGTVNVYVSSNNTKPGSPDITVSNGTNTLPIDNLYLFSESSGPGIVMDIIRISSL